MRDYTREELEEAREKRDSLIAFEGLTAYLTLKAGVKFKFWMNRT